MKHRRHRPESVLSSLGALLGLAAALLMSSTTVGLAQPAQVPRVGTFLVAAESMADPRFQQTVILLIRHDPGGTVGLIVNQPALADANLFLPNLPEQFDGIFLGGPVSRLRPTVLLRAEAPPEGSLRVLENTYVIGLEQTLRHLTKQEQSAARFRIYLGYAGWTSWQLARELARGDWQVVPADEKALFEDDPTRLWKRLHRLAENILI